MECFELVLGDTDSVNPLFKFVLLPLFLLDDQLFESLLFSQPSSDPLRPDSLRHLLVIDRFIPQELLRGIESSDFLLPVVVRTSAKISFWLTWQLGQAHGHGFLFPKGIVGSILDFCLAS